MMAAHIADHAPMTEPMPESLRAAIDKISKPHPEDHEPLKSVLAQLKKSAERSRKIRHRGSLIGFIFTISLPFVMLVIYPGDDGWSWYNIDPRQEADN
jgi:hypothetical protein